ncbi:hypothetical protein [Rhizobium leguminosarum]|uniref:hypothetical protein n=1 Tax=Rhizobium leguminosarum TaxID=384 RepID=UPI003F99463D
MDEIAEYLWASSSDFESLLESCRNSDASPLKVGATSISTALLQRRDPSAAHGAIRRMLEAARTDALFFEASARATAESGNAQWVKESD